MIDHTKLHISDIAKSRAFYEAALAPIGYGVIMEGDDGKRVGFGTGFPDFWIAEDGETLTNVHVAFRVKTTGEVDAFHAAAIAAGGVDHGEPGPRPHIHPEYYGAFVFDPDGNNIEVVNHGSLFG
jgi:catechol 2,3-dioxygenase-like lactoylglutathione lyase family enzyme